MNLNEQFPSRFLKADDFPDDFRQELEIAGFSLEEFDDPKTRKRETKPVMYFSGGGPEMHLPNGDRKGLILNKTNAKTLQKVFRTPDTDLMIGQRIILIRIEIDAFGEIQGALRLKESRPGVQLDTAYRTENPLPPAAPIENEAPPVEEDDIPF